MAFPFAFPTTQWFNKTWCHCWKAYPETFKRAQENNTVDKMEGTNYSLSFPSAEKEPGCLYYQCTLCLSYFPQEIETVISGKTNLQQSSWEWYMPGYPHLPRFPTWPTWQRDNGEWCQQPWRPWLSCSPASSAISLQLSLFYCSTGEEFDGVRLMAQDR